MYWEQTAAMRVENKTSTFQDIKRGVRQGCVLSPDLFSLYSEIIMQNLENHPGIKVDGQNINNLRYADDTVLIAENKEDLQKLLNIVEEKSRKKGLELNSKKTEVMNYTKTSSHISGPRDEKRKTGTFGKLEGKRSRGRQREKITDGLATWLGPGRVTETLTAFKDRDLWRDMITNAYKQGTCPFYVSARSISEASGTTLV
ncbi:retrovirus-related pol polyprotein from type-1 retrotransposable element r2 [Plakobranchus ocellatus]|uniref:Retrovirus-related pol polyprotein from type-1 retrotransposable element r2 n=1 Tax=Plakobranchus ocellatus TaxID=259542 RepID=A0AAV4AL64_9GAST|nr:retrovirus-related pol polyprotein from type-1 retrotransposable element r2 [Plakobranchus ocellatus]